MIGRTIPLLCATLIMIGAFTSANAEPAQRAVAPEAVIPGLKKVLIVDVGGGTSLSVADSVGDRTRRNLGFDNRIPNASPGIDTRIAELERHRSRNILTTDRIRSLAERNEAQGVVEIQAQVVRSTDVPYERTVNRSVKGDDGETVTKEVTVPCIRREVEVGADMRVFDAQGTLLFSRRLSQTDQPAACDIPWQRQSISSLAPAEAISSRRFERFADILVRDFMPHWRRFEYEIELDRVVRPIMRQVDRNPTAAVTKLLNVKKVDPYNPRVMYTLGLALELDGRPEQAQVVFKLADRLGNNSTFTDAAARAQTTLRHHQILEQAYGLSVKPVVRPELDQLIRRASRAAESEVMGSPARTKGGRNRRNPVFESPSGQSAVLLTVPGRIHVRRIRTDNGFVEVQLPDGMRGWMRARRIR
ncbi:MAG: hypothetical protein EA397_08925 [Deltaproteobacteria bacterium]|nr:MAG: hypothetical protein EA397_08925 [Deltaproteobacteria bacterium]